MDKVFSKMLDNRLLVLFGAMVLFGAAAYGLKFAEVKTDYRVYFKQDEPLLLAHNLMYETYTSAETVLMILAPVYLRPYLRTQHFH